LNPSTNSYKLLRPFLLLDKVTFGLCDLIFYLPHASPHGSPSLPYVIPHGPPSSLACYNVIWAYCRFPWNSQRHHT
jgi:hypothetical protein